MPPCRHAAEKRYHNIISLAQLCGLVSYTSALTSYTFCCKMTEILGPGLICDEVIKKRSERHELDI